MLAALCAFQLSKTPYIHTIIQPRHTLASRTRHASTTTSILLRSGKGALDPRVREYVSKLAEYQPCFAMSSKDVKILKRPDQFYQLLLDMIRRAKKRIFISSLYIGSEETELITALHTALQTNPTLQLHLLLDLNRSTRPGPSPSTATLLLPLSTDFPSRVNVSLFRSPKLKGWLASVVPPRYNEGWGTWHPKVYGVDDEVVISGANLNESYFTNRQDRYLHFTSQPHFAQYCFDFLQSASQFSYRLLPAPTPFKPAPAPAPTSSPSPSSLSLSAQSQPAYELRWPDPNVHPHHIESKASRILSQFQEIHRLSSSFRHPLPISSSSSSSHQHQNDISNSNSEKHLSSSANTGRGDGEGDGGTEADVLVFPIIQAGQFGIREEERALGMLFDELGLHQEQEMHGVMGSSDPSPSSSSSRIEELEEKREENEDSNGVQERGPSVLDMTTGYFGLYRPYRDLVLQSPVGCRIVCSAPKANGFYGSRGPSGRLPEGYTLLEQKFMKAVRDAKRQWFPSSQTTSVDSSTHPGVELREWEKEGWTYHAKGLWLRPTPTSPPTLTLFGSTNLNSRSANLDTELSFVMVTTSPELREELKNEVEGLREHSKEWKGDERKVRIGTKVLVGLMGGML